MSLAALALVLGYVALFGTTQEQGGDEGTAAHIWQILMAAQIPVVLFFAIKWLPRAPKQALQVLALQAVTYLASLAALFFFEN